MADRTSVAVDEDVLDVILADADAFQTQRAGRTAKVKWLRLQSIEELKWQRLLMNLPCSGVEGIGEDFEQASKNQDQGLLLEAVDEQVDEDPVDEGEHDEAVEDEIRNEKESMTAIRFVEELEQHICINRLLLLRFARAKIRPKQLQKYTWKAIAEKTGFPES